MQNVVGVEQVDKSLQDYKGSEGKSRCEREGI